MKIEQARELANAVLYEGYLLYPYRKTAIKNRRRWTFGVVYPRAYSQAGGEIEPWMMQTECLMTGSPDTQLDVYVRFLHLLVRSVEQPATSNAAGLAQEGASEWSVAARMVNEPWEEGIEREVSALNLSLCELLARPVEAEIAIAGDRLVSEAGGEDEGEATEVREQQPLAGVVRIAAVQVGEDVYRLRVQIENHTLTGSLESQYAVMRHSFVSTHTLVQVRQGSFISLMDPPPVLRTAAQECQNRHSWPVLAGEAGELDTILSSPIILYDYPQIAPESPGPLFDGTEIDEILTLRIMTLSDDEKDEIRRGDERAREILERTESLTPEQFMQLHGTMRHPQNPENSQAEPGAQYTPPAPDVQFAVPEIGMRFSTSGAANEYPGEDYLPPSSVEVDGREVIVGSRVRLRPQVRSDVFDLLLSGKTARVEAIQQDFENRVYLVVTVDDDPGRVQWDERVMPGHRFYFFPQEVELLDEKEEAPGRQL